MTTRQRAISLILFVLFLIPSAQFAWRNRDMPEFSYLHDDGLLFVTAKSVADGNGFRVASLPENPAQTKFPPLYPALLSMVWKLNPHFPENLELATALGWLLTVTGLALAWTLYRLDGHSIQHVWILAALLAISPYWTLFGSMMFSEMTFTCLVLACFILMRQAELKNNSKLIFAAGIVAACAYLTRTAGLALLVSVPVFLLWKRKWKSTALFAIPTLVAALSWSIWQKGHLPHTSDLTLLYYTDYIGFRNPNFGLDNATLVLWKNLDQIIYSIGALVLPKIVDMLPVKILTQVIGVAMLSGVVRLVRRGIARDYALFCLASTGILLLWNFPANERMVLPMFPMLIAGFVTEIEHFFGMLRSVLFAAKAADDVSAKKKKSNDRGNQIVGAIFGTGVAALLLVAIGVQAFMTFSFMNANTAQQREKLEQRKAAYQWMAQNLPRNANVLSYDDPLLYLYTGHHGNYMPMMTRWWYADDHKSMQQAYERIADYCRGRRLNYLYFTSEDLSRETGEEDRLEVAKSIKSNSELEPVFKTNFGTIYHVKPIGVSASQTSASANPSITVAR